jgi:hypothetical protein
VRQENHIGKGSHVVTSRETKKPPGPRRVERNIHKGRLNIKKPTNLKEEGGCVEIFNSTQRNALPLVYRTCQASVNRVKINAENVENRHLFDGGFRGNRDTVSMGY